MLACMCAMASDMHAQITAMTAVLLLMHRYDPESGPFGQDLYIAQFIYRYFGYDAAAVPLIVPIVLGFSVAFWLAATAGLKWLSPVTR